MIAVSAAVFVTVAFTWTPPDSTVNIATLSGYQLWCAESGQERGLAFEWEINPTAPGEYEIINGPFTPGVDYDCDVRSVTLENPEPSAASNVVTFSVPATTLDPVDDLAVTVTITAGEPEPKPQPK